MRGADFNKGFLADADNLYSSSAFFKGQKRDVVFIPVDDGTSWEAFHVQSLGLIRKASFEYIDSFIANLKNSADSLPEWSDDVWNVLVESATVHCDGSITFKFKNGKEITV